MNRPATLLLTALVALAVPVPASAQKSPEEALKTFTVAEGLDWTLFASEPMFTNPTCIDVDHKGRVWVCESVNYRTQLRKRPLNRPEGDRIVVLEDTDGDGKADKATTFYQAKDFIAPLGIAVAPDPDGKGQKVYICHSPHIYLFEDKDGDLKADGKPQVLLTGFRGYDHDHGVHGIHFGPDGKLYFSVGDQGVQGLKDRYGKVWTTNQTDCRAGTCWRCDPDGKNLEFLAHNFRNQYEPAVNSFGTMFVSDNDDDGNQQTRICYVMYGGNYGYWPRGRGESHWHEEQPGVVHKVLRTYFGSPTGMCWYEGTLLPRKYQGQLLHTDAGPRHVRCYHVKPKGAGYEIAQEILVSSSDNWFRPSDVCVAPDGSVFVSDWYDPGVGGHGMGDTTRGRIYRLTPKEHKGYKVPAVDVSNSKGILAALGSPNIATRYSAIQGIKSMPTGDASRFLQSVLQRDTEDSLFARAFWLLHQLPEQEFSVATFAFPDAKEKPWTAMSVRTLKDRYLRICDAPEGYRKMLRQLSAPDIMGPVFRREMLLALRDSDPVFAAEWIMELAQQYDGQDHFYLAAIGIAVGTDPKRREVILADFEKHFPEWNDKVAKLVWELRPPQVIAKLDQRLADPKLSAAQKAQILDILAVTEGTTGGAVLLRVLADNPPAELREQALKNLRTFLPTKWSALKKDPALKSTIAKLLAGKDLRVHSIELLVAADLVAEHEMDMLALAGDRDEPQPVRLAAVWALGELKSAEAADRLAKLMDDEGLRKDVLASLGKMATPRAFHHLQTLLKDDTQPLDLRREAVVALASSRPGSVWLLEAHAKKELPEAVLPEVARVMRNSPYQDLRAKALIAFPPPGRIDPNQVPPIARLMRYQGDAARGRQLFVSNKDLGCVRCHSVRGSGGNIGPDLSMIGKKASRENLFESILFPDKAIADQYIQVNVETQKGDLLIGLVIEETKDHLILRDALGKDTKILQSDIAQKAKNPKSIMPSDLLIYMTEQDLVDIVAYLTTLTTPALTIDAWHIVGPFDNGRSGLDTVYPPEEKIDLSASYAGKNGRVHWRTVKPNAEGYVDLRALYGADGDAIISYLVREIESPADQEATLLLGTDDAAKLWLNGELVYTNRQHRPAAPEQDKVTVKLKKGKNTILLKITNGDGGHGFYFSILSAEELKLVGMNER
jgi:putative membrane-bound dehydrogenase-like protein